MKMQHFNEKNDTVDPWQKKRPPGSLRHAGVEWRGDIDERNARIKKEQEAAAYKK